MTDEKIRSADELLFQEESKRMGVTPPPMPEVPKQDLQKTKDEEPTPEEVKPTESLEAEEAEKAPEEHAEKEEIQASDDSLETDDYGNPVSKGKTYTEEEVQRMIRERLARGRNTEQQAQVQEVAADFKADPESDESWETQLGAFVENKINELAQKKEQQHWKQQEETTQAEFEDKFTTGMGKYSDFHSVVGGKPISNSMMMATRSMDDPAAFLYAACKQQSAEVERIAKIQDPTAPIVAIGRLEEKMKKVRMITSAPKPAKRISGDASDKMPERSIDQLIASHAKDKMVYKRK